ncbi:sugar ABC transporter substrate-binding protein [Paenibacillus nasutitermitis]|uniref:sugar ABC transporter substrate-binding protein n=1 Tax=Paenibacillus nasutitermitis TaxID=1652958 RepID=UPI00166B29F8|nr:extracellular solute-binding protein [Paenibacillus nasutitermitis]
MKKGTLSKALCAVALVSLLLVGCSGNSGNESGEKAADGKVTINYWGSMTPEFTDYLVKKVEETYPDINLKISAIPGVTGGGDPFINAAAAGTLPDLFNSNPTGGSTYSDMGITNPLSTFSDFKEAVANVDPNLIETGRMGDGEVHNLITYGATPVMVYYNTKLWQEAGLTKADIPTTWTKFVEVAKKLTKSTAGGKTDQYGLELITDGRGGGFNFQLGYALYWSITGNPNAGFLSKDGKQVILDKQAYAKTIGLVSDLILKEKTSPPERTQDIFPTGTIGMALNGPGFATVLEDPDKSKVVGQWDLFPLPTLGLGKGTSNALPVGGRTIMMSRNTKHPEEAWKVIKILMSDEVQMQVYKDLGEFPVSKTVQADPEFASDKVVSAFLNQDNTQVNGRDPFYYSLISDNLSPAYNEVLAGKAKPEQAVDAAVTKLQQLIDEDQKSREVLLNNK